MDAEHWYFKWEPQNDGLYRWTAVNHLGDRAELDVETPPPGRAGCAVKRDVNGLVVLPLALLAARRPRRTTAPPTS
jgi:hypothetical protein